MTRHDAIFVSLAGGLCPLCSGSKHSGRTACDECTAKMPVGIRHSLCCRHEDYPAAFERMLCAVADCGWEIRLPPGAERAEAGKETERAL